MNGGNALVKEILFSTFRFPHPESAGPLPGRCRAEVRAARSERSLAGHGERQPGGAQAGGGERWRRRRLGAGRGPAAGRSAVGLHRAGRPGVRRAAHHLQGSRYYSIIS